MRESEILGLQWEDLDFENRTINVVHNLVHARQYKNRERELYQTSTLTPKSKTSIRTIPMNDTVFELLKNRKRISDIVFSNETGDYIIQSTLQFAWRRKLLNSDLRYRKFHDLRHTFATLMLAKGCDLITLKELMGHSSVTITEIYLQAIPNSKKEAIKNMDFIKF